MGCRVRVARLLSRVIAVIISAFCSVFSDGLCARESAKTCKASATIGSAADAVSCTVLRHGAELIDAAVYMIFSLPEAGLPGSAGEAVRLATNNNDKNLQLEEESSSRAVASQGIVS